MGLTKAILLLAFLQALVNSEYIPPGPKYRCPEQKLLLHPCTCESESDQGITVKCENTNLASMSVGLNNLATFKLPIEKLTIYKCNIGRLFGSLLYKLQLRILHIEDTPIEIIEEHTFLGINETLNELYVYNSKLKEFPKLAINILGNLTILKLDTHNIPSLPTDAFTGQELVGKLLRFHCANGNLTSLPTESLKPLRKLKTLDLHGNQLNTLKKGQFKGLRDTEILDLSYNNINKMDGSHLADLTKLGWCNVSHNQLTELTRGAFARNAVLKVLNISHNKIKRLDSNSFRGMRFLRRLYLSDNLISDVARGTFTSVARIGTIDLARNFIKKIDYQMFYQLNFIEILDLSANNITEIQKQAFKDVFFANVNLSRNAITKIENNAFENCANMTVLDLSYNKIETIPKRAFDENTYATELLLQYNFLTELNQVPLHNMSGLKILNVAHNEITKIPRHTFPKLYELHTIDLSYNNLTDIFNSVFQTLFSLRSLNLSYNSLETIKPSTFGTLPTLLVLDLSYNNIKDMARSALSRLASTRTLILKGNRLETLFILPISTSHLDLSENQFKELPTKLWPSMNSLLTLDFSHNQLGDKLYKGSFESLLTLQKLNLNYNGIESIPWPALNELSSLQYLYLEGNNLAKLNRAAFGRMPVLFELNLAHNKLNNISSRAFEGLLQLIVLNLNNNNISYMSSEAMQGLVALQDLDLSFNNIERIDNKTHGLLDDCLSIRKINLSHNKISFISRKTFPSNIWIPYKLTEIDLSYNSMPVITFDLTFGTSKLEKLNLSHNAISDIRRGALGNMTNIKILDLSFNTLEDLITEKDSFRLPKHLSELYLGHNQLKKLPWEYVNNVTLKVLDISYNQFETFEADMYKMLQDNKDVIFEGNPLNCDCFTRPLKRYTTNQLNLNEIYKSITCRGPPYVANSHLYELPEDRLNCPVNVNTTAIMEAQPGEYDITPDFKFREFIIKDYKIKAKWLVAKNEDIADPYIVIQEIKNRSNVVYETTLPYFKRNIEIDAKNTLKSLLKSDFSKFQLCVLAKDSSTSVRNLYKQQCKELPKSLGNSGVTIKLSVILAVMLILKVLLH